MTSIVGRYLEHSRIYIFGTPERAKIYISSADLMTRNTVRRVEVAAPVYDEKLKKRILDMFNTLIHDNVKARKQLPDGTYVYKINDEPPVNAQQQFINEAYANAEKKSAGKTSGTGKASGTGRAKKTTSKTKKTAAARRPGRPKKSESSQQTSASPTPKRRGRPRKSETAPEVNTTQTPKRRGRPPKKVTTDNHDN